MLIDLRFERHLSAGYAIETISDSARYHVVCCNRIISKINGNIDCGRRQGI